MIEHFYLILTLFMEFNSVIKFDIGVEFHLMEYLSAML